MIASHDFQVPNPLTGSEHVGITQPWIPLITHLSVLHACGRKLGDAISKFIPGVVGMRLHMGPY